MRQYKVGDVVQIRQWNDMAREFGLTSYGTIICGNCGFPLEMKKYCGKKLIITAISYSANNYYYLNDAPWTFTSDMFEKSALSMLITRRQECIK